MDQISKEPKSPAASSMRMVKHNPLKMANSYYFPGQLNKTQNTAELTVSKTSEASV